MVRPPGVGIGTFCHRVEERNAERIRRRASLSQKADPEKHLPILPPKKRPAKVRGQL